MLDAKFNFAADSRRGIQEPVERVDDHAFGGVLDGDDAEVHRSGFHLVEHLIHRGQRERPHRMTEVREHRGLRERAFRSQERDLQRLLLRQARGHDLPEQPQQILGAQRPVVALLDHAQYLRFTLGTIEINGGAGSALGDAHLLGEPAAIAQQLLQLLIDGVDLRAHRAKIHGLRSVHVFKEAAPPVRPRCRESFPGSTLEPLNQCLSECRHIRHGTCSEDPRCSGPQLQDRWKSVPPYSVRCDWRPPGVSRRPRVQHGLGKIDAVADVAILQVITNRIRDHDSAVLLSLPGGGAQVRQRHTLAWSLRALFGKSQM